MTDVTIMEVLTHLGTFVLGWATCRALTIWEGKNIKTQGETVTDAKERKPRAVLSRNTVVAVFTIAFSLMFAGLGLQQIQYQHQGERFRKDAIDNAECYRQWGKDLTKALDKRVTANTKQTTADHTRANASDNVLLVVLRLQKANPPLTTEQKQVQFEDALRSFAKAKAAQDKVNRETAKTRVKNPYPKLECDSP